MKTAKKWDPYQEGLKFIETLKGAEGGALTSVEIHNKYGITSAMLRQSRASRGIIFWRERHGAFHYPVWQFGVSGAVLPGIEDLLQLFASEDQWRIMLYFLSNRRSLRRRRPLDLLRTGELNFLLKMTRGYVADNNW